MSGNNIIDDLKNQFKYGDILIKFIFVNIGVWLTLQIFKILFFFFGIDSSTVFDFARNWLAVPSNIILLIKKPWTLFSYMFLHFEIMHILFNMLMLYWFGKIFLMYLKSKQFVTVYILGGLAGGLLYVISFNVFPVFNNLVESSYALGASASVLAIVIAIATYIPNFKINLFLIGPVKLKYIAIFSVVLDFLQIDSNNSGGHIAHIGGAILGYFYIVQLKKGKDWATIFYKIIDAIGSLFRFKRSKLKVEYSAKKSSRPVSDEDYNLNKKKEQDTMDEILDKIKKSGYDSLTSEEKNFLFNISKRN